MASTTGDRAEKFPLIEKKYGHPVSFWFDRLRSFESTKYEDQMGLLQEDYGFSRAHANTLVMYFRGSTTTKRFSGAAGYIAALPADQAATVSTVLEVAAAAVPGSEVVIAWNQPMLKLGKDYLFGVTAAKKHLLLLPLGDNIFATFAKEIEGLTTGKKTIQVPSDWKVDKKFIKGLVLERLAQLHGTSGAPKKAAAKKVGPAKRAATRKAAPAKKTAAKKAAPARKSAVKKVAKKA